MVDNCGTLHVKFWLRRSFQQEQNGGEFRFFPWVILLGLLVGGARYWSSNKEVLGLFLDDGIYAVVAKSLNDGAGYRIISLPTTPDQTKYPFLYSYILSWLWSLDPRFPDNLGLLKAVNAGFLAAIFILSYLFYRERVKGQETEGWISHYLFSKKAATTRAWFGLRLPVSWGGFSETFEWIRSHTDDKAVLATFYDPMYYLYTGRRAIRPGFHKPQTYFYPYGQAVADIERLFNELVRSYRNRPELMFISSDSKHRIYVLPDEY
jgi:hypothetical protein